jgi:hypothetical protein
MRGGWRPGGGRPKGVKDKAPRKSRKPEPTEAEKTRQMLAMGIKAKARFYQDYLLRCSRGEKLTVSEQKMMEKLGAELEAEVGEKPPAALEIGEKLQPLDFMLQVMNDPKEDKELRARMAVAAAPFCHPRKGEGAGKKDEKNDRAKAAGSGKFAASAPPLRVVK